MKTAKYLYGVRPYWFADLPYRVAIGVKLDAGRRLLRKLAICKTDEERYLAVEKAIKFNEELLKEADYANNNNRGEEI